MSVRKPRSRQTAADPPPLLLGDHPALDFLNTRVRIYSDAPEERIGTGIELLDWTVLCGLTTTEEIYRARRRFSISELDAVAKRARTLRENLRSVVALWARGASSVDNRALRPLNDMLAAGQAVSSVEVSEGRFVLVTRHRVDAAGALLGPIGQAFADLLVETDPALVRECASDICSLWFYDRTRSHCRRWCSMDWCGARAKVAAFRARQVTG